MVDQRKSYPLSNEPIQADQGRWTFISDNQIGFEELRIAKQLTLAERQWEEWEKISFRDEFEFTYLKSIFKIPKICQFLKFLISFLSILLSYFQQAKLNFVFWITYLRKFSSFL